MSLPALSRVAGFSRDDLRTGGAPNMLRNGGFRDGTACWTFNANTLTGATFSVLTPTNGSGLADGDVTGWVATASSSSTAAISCPVAGSGNAYVEQQVPVEAKRYYSLSGMLNKGANIAGMTLSILWRTGTNSAIATETVDIANSGAGLERDWTQYRIEAVQAPTTARSAIIRMTATAPVITATAFAFLDQMWFGPGRVAFSYTVEFPPANDVSWT